MDFRPAADLESNRSYRIRNRKKFRPLSHTLQLQAVSPHAWYASGIHPYLGGSTIRPKCETQPARATGSSVRHGSFVATAPRVRKELSGFSRRNPERESENL